MKFVLIIGSGAVGKMSVGQELMKKTNLRLFHNHMMIEPLIEIFGYHNGDLASRLREEICRDFAKTDLYGMIFTFMWAFDTKNDWEFIKKITGIFKEQNAEIYCVELVADQETRLTRNATENRLNNKASKRNLEFSTGRILHEDISYRLESFENELPFKNYIKIDNTNLTIKEQADIIIEKFKFERI